MSNLGINLNDLEKSGYMRPCLPKLNNIKYIRK